MVAPRRLPLPTLLPMLLVLLSAPSGAAEFRLCTGNPGKTYHAVGTVLAELMPALSRRGLTLTVVPTGGSTDNLQRLVDGQCEGAISQGDVVALVAEQAAPASVFQLVTALYKELSLLLCHENSGVTELDDLLALPDPVVAAGSEGSGSLATWRIFRQLESAYHEIRLLPVNGMEGASAVAAGKATCLFEVIAPRSDFLGLLNDDDAFAQILRFASVGDEFERFRVAGQPVYSRVEFDDEAYPALGHWGDPTLLAITAYLVVTEDWAQHHPELLLDLSQALLTSHNEIEQVAYGAQRPFVEQPDQ